MKKLSANEVRQMFLDFYESKGHTILDPVSLVPVDDPTLLWINSGVATIKKYFDGTETPPNVRLANSQKSIRTNDIENVGYTARHHTLFEMLGNFSIGDYFKEEAIVWAWELLTEEKWFAMDPEKLSVTIYPDDKESHRIWHEVVGLPEDRIIELEENFWDIGAGPSGPNTEIFYDRGQEYNDLEEDDPESFPGGENERWLEIWNIVFSQFNHLPDDTYEPLPNKNIDAGMGLERMVSLSQDAETNFETDLFIPLIKKVEDLSGVTYGQDSKVDASFKIIADHIRAVSFAISDGALPSNDGRGYILRRLIRRSVLHGQKLGIEGQFLEDLVPVVSDIMGDYYTDLRANENFVKEVIEREENRFHETLADGLAILNDIISSNREEGINQIDGSQAFKLYDTYGFPLELTQEFAEENQMTVDEDGFEDEMSAQRERARQARSDEQSMAIQTDVFNHLDEESEFTGYSQHEDQAKIIYMVQDEDVVAEVPAGQQAKIVFDQTPFYAEKGGQVGDKGYIYDDSQAAVAKVIDVQTAPAGQNLHLVEALKDLELGQSYHLEIDVQRRKLIRRNHTATHLLHQALRDVLGDHVHQAGSLVAPDLLRFDFSHLEAVSPEELDEIEQVVNEKIWENIPLDTVETDIDTAKDMGAMALFGEKYGDEVRVVCISDYSKELCGGTHVDSTGEIGLFKITQETGVGAGVRRIFAQTSQGAFEWLEEQLDMLEDAQNLTKAQTRQDVPSRIQAMQEKIKGLESELESMKHQLANEEAASAFENVEEVEGVSYIASSVNVSDMSQLRDLADQWKQDGQSDILVLALEKGEKANLLVAMKDTAIQKGLKSGELINRLAKEIKGGGGGRPDMAQAGGSYPQGIPAALALVPTWIQEQL